MAKSLGALTDSSSTICSSSVEFFKVFVPYSSSHRMSIPPGFAKYLNGTFPEQATMKDHTGKAWRVTLEKENELVYFNHGWKAFVDYHFLKHGDFLVFEFDGRCRFEVKIFGKNGFKKAVVAEAHNSVQVLKINQAAVVEEVEIEDVKPIISSKLQVESEIVHKPKIKGASKRGRPRNAPKSVEEYVAPERPFFERTMKHWCHKKFYISGRLVKKLRISMKRKIVLRDEEGKLWPVTVSPTSQNRIPVSGGWSKFYKSHKLKVNDKCEFEFVLETGNNNNICTQLNVKIKRCCLHLC